MKRTIASCLVCQRLRADQIDAHGAGAQRVDIVAGGDDARLAALDEIEPERRGAEPDIHLPGHGLRDGRGDIAGRLRFRGEMILRDQRQHEA